MIKHFTLVLSFLTSVLAVSAQKSSLPIVYAEGGEGKNVIYRKLTKTERDQMPGYVWGDCSNCLSATDCNIRASSTLPSQGSANYAAKNMQDDDPTTAWVEGQSDYGIGQYIEFKNGRTLNSITILNGYQKSPKSFFENSRVKTLRVSENGIDRCLIRLKDEMGAQYINTDKLSFEYNGSENGIANLRFTITEVYQGIKYKDVAISEIFAQGCCVSGQSKIILHNNIEKEFHHLSTGDSITFIDNQNKIIYATAIETGSIMHDLLLKITTENGNNITLTPGHYVYTTGGKKIQARHLTSSDSLQLIYNQESIYWDKIISISKIQNPTKTYYFKKLNFGNYNIAWPVKAVFNNVVTDDEYLDKINLTKGNK